MFKIDLVTAINIVRDSLRDNLTDPQYTAGGQGRSGEYWVFSDEPTLSTFPQIQLLKIDNPSVPIEIGPNYMEYKQVFINIWFKCKNGFKVNISGTEYKNAQLVEYYLELITDTLKDEFTTLSDAGVKMYKPINTTEIGYDPNTQLYSGAATIRVAYFKR